MTGRQAASYALALIPAGLLPATIGLAGPVYFAGALALGIFYLTYVGPLLVRRLRRSRPAGCCGPRSSTCPRSCCSCC